MPEKYIETAPEPLFLALKERGLTYEPYYGYWYMPLTSALQAMHGVILTNTHTRPLVTEPVDRIPLLLAMPRYDLVCYLNDKCRSIYEFSGHHLDSLVYPVLKLRLELGV